MLGAMAAWTGTFAAVQTIRGLLGGAMGDPQWGKLHLLDGLKPAMRTLNIANGSRLQGLRLEARPIDVAARQVLHTVPESNITQVGPPCARSLGSTAVQ